METSHRATFRSTPDNGRLAARGEEHVRVPRASFNGKYMCADVAVCEGLSI